ncbi:cold-inducible protein YdjO-related protein [Bacillus sp. CGMCC 1.16541]|uniref:cold-inducible protein YdjO-related protein n=1 Tax=Bacillus sp. CGMCC 1.16541 TaxID=2185143 RepID=UPI000D728839|nr:cold-inducible protein YdjO-related protein [Bacillus sp. CGMCC 1.16541]
MSYYNKRVEPLPEEHIDTLECTKDDCNGWMRKNFSIGDSVQCPFCKSDMKSGTRFINNLPNTAPYTKATPSNAK